MSKMSMVNAGVSKFSGLEKLELILFDLQVDDAYNKMFNGTSRESNLIEKKPELSPEEKKQRELQRKIRKRERAREYARRKRWEEKYKAKEKALAAARAANKGKPNITN